MLGAVKALWNSEKAVTGGLLVIGATVLVLTGHVTSQEWMEYTKWIFGFYVGGKTAQGIATTMMTRRGQPPAEGGG